MRPKRPSRKPALHVPKDKRLCKYQYGVRSHLDQGKWKHSTLREANYKYSLGRTSDLNPVVVSMGVYRKEAPFPGGSEPFYRLPASCSQVKEEVVLRIILRKP